MNIAIIPARSGSKRIINKNIKIFNGKPIIYYAIKNAISSKLFKKIYVTTDSYKIKKIAEKYGAEVPYLREKKLSNDHVPINEVIKAFLKKIDKYKISIVCCIFPCSPFVKPLDLRKAYNQLLKNNSGFVFSALRYTHPIQRSFKLVNKKIIINNYKYLNKRTQDLEINYHDAGQFYFGYRNFWEKNNNVFKNGNIYELPKHQVLDIDDIEDWNFAKKIYSLK